MASRIFHVIAHRGDASQAPENTLRAFDAAVRAGADEIECDVRVTKDGVAVLVHDPSLLRTANKDVQVKDLTLEELRQFDAGIFRGEKFKNTRVPTLEEAFVKHLAKIPFEVELKSPGTVVGVVQLLQKHAAEGAFERVLVISFHRELLVSARMLDSRIKIGWLLESHSPVTLAEVKHLGALAVMPSWEDVTKDFVDDAHKLGLFVRPWGAKNIETVKKIVELGADGTTYDNPSELIAFLKEAGVRQDGVAIPPLAAVAASHKASENGKANGKAH